MAFNLHTPTYTQKFNLSRAGGTIVNNFSVGTAAAAGFVPKKPLACLKHKTDEGPNPNNTNSHTKEMLQQNLVRFLDLVEAISFRFRLLMAKAKLFARLDVVCDLCRFDGVTRLICLICFHMFFVFYVIVEIVVSV